MLLVTQIAKFGIILSDPQNHEFKYWFYQCFQYPPYSFMCHTVHGDAFPMAYSLFWYAIYVPLTARGYWVFSLTMLTVDSITGYLVSRYRSQLGLAIWAQGSLYFLLASPQDFLIWTLILASWTRLGPAASALAVLTKLPLLPPIFDPAIWNYILYNPYSVHDPMNWARYTLIGSYWTLFLSLWLYKHGRLGLLQNLVNRVHIQRPNLSVNLARQYGKPPDSPPSDCHRTSTRQHSCHLDQFSQHRTSTVQRGTKPRHHRTIDLRSHHTVRSHPAYQTPEGNSRIRIPFRPNSPKTLVSLTKKAERAKRAPRLLASGLFLLILALTLLPAIGPVHAISQYVGYVAGQVGASTCGANCVGTTNVNYGLGQLLKAPFTGTLTSVFLVTGSSVPNRVVISTFTGTPTTSNNGCSGGGNCPLATAGQSSTVQDSELLTGLATSSPVTITLASPVSVTNGQWVAVMYANGQATGAIIMLCGTGANPACHTTPDTGTTIDSEINFGSTNPSNGNTVTTVTADIGAGMLAGGTFQTTGTVSPTPTLTQCYGNCGNPAVTLANTNSTHTTNFNSSTTLLYVFQSSLNGFVKNVTIPVAKVYNNGMRATVGLYTTTQTCTSTNNPFTPQCPGFLAFSATWGGGGNTICKCNIFALGNTPAGNGQWFAVAITASFGGFDVNDTNTSVALSQTGGAMPSVLNGYTPSTNPASPSKMALYAWIVGNQVIVGPPIGGVQSGCNTPTCGALALWGALGGDTFAGIIVFIILFGFTAGCLLWITRQHNDKGQVTGFALPGEILLIIGVLFLIGLSAIGILPPWIPVAIIMMAAAGFGGVFVLRRKHGSEAA